ncbi:hypothetical protein M1I95_10505 [Rossellomorea marisflavi]|uniref:hypothetical protein n=1 Tax=Rossellomorea marisflavi TaxID=189381 RepID=UPI0027A8CFF8|nr:hypothetical protein [Rossellomorea marisflavi]UTE74836.1 hypothetical protein M1I95_10505 [Rossellomorea marisflavi]
MSQKGKWVLALSLLGVVFIAGFVVYILSEDAERNEFITFREELDDTFFKSREEVVECYRGFEEDQVNLDCNPDHIKQRIDEGIKKLNEYEVKSDDTFTLKYKTQDGYRLLKKIDKENSIIISSDPTSDEYVKAIKDFAIAFDELEKNGKSINKTLELYYSF